MSLVLKWELKDVFTNGLNFDILSPWKENTDLQYLINEYSTTAYVYGYNIKSKKAMGELLKRVG